MNQNRRSFLCAFGGLTATGLLSGFDVELPGQAAEQLHIASNEFSWITFYKREGKDWFSDLDVSLKEVAKAGIAGYEPSIKKPEDLDILEPLLKKYTIQMRSIYVGCTLHTEEEAAKSLEKVLAIAKAARSLGAKIIVTNPSPIRTEAGGAKMDAQLALQAKNLDLLGAELRKLGMTLAYHNHDKEMVHAAREFHHMMLATDPKHVSLCLEAHWLFRGSGNSQLAMFDVLQLYGSRIVEVHLRQSKNGIWSETFEDGDIDYKKMALKLSALNIRPHLVLEQCIEKESPHTMDALTAHRKDFAYASSIFDSLK
jgi:inosose dehydratase